MIDEKALNDYVLEQSNNVLERGFDDLAYICRYIAKKSLESADRVPQSHIDEDIDDIQKLFVSYMQDKTNDRWQALLNHILQMLTELYMTTDVVEQKEAFHRFVEKINLI